MAQNREPPAYQEYAATIMAKVQYRAMSLEERGLLYTMRLECWVNECLPSDEPRLAKVIGYSIEEIKRCLPAVKNFFYLAGGSLRCKELDDYRAHLESRTQKQSAGGRLGAQITNAKKGRLVTPDSSASPSGEPQVELRVLSKAQASSDKYNQAQPVDKGFDEGVDSFISDYENKELYDWRTVYYRDE